MVCQTIFELPKCSHSGMTLRQTANRKWQTANGLFPHATVGRHVVFLQFRLPILFLTWQVIILLYFAIFLPGFGHWHADRYFEHWCTVFADDQKFYL
jgi:hypothetical protein